MRNWFWGDLIPLFYELIVIDPPWEFETYSDKGKEKSAEAQYETMPDDEILRLPVADLASDNCLLLLWATSSKLPLAIQCVTEWGFTYQTFMVWRKVTKRGKISMGTGYRVRSTGEIVIVATLGKPKQHCAPQTIFDGERREHSRKPETFYSLCDRVMPHARRADVFARQRRQGWHSFGKELDKFEGEAA